MSKIFFFDASLNLPRETKIQIEALEFTSSTAYISRDKASSKEPQETRRLDFYGFPKTNWPKMLECVDGNVVIRIKVQGRRVDQVLKMGERLIIDPKSEVDIPEFSVEGGSSGGSVLCYSIINLEEVVSH